MPEHCFGESPPLSLGVEEEILLVDDGNLLLPVADRVLDSVAPEVADGVTSEIFSAQIEIKTGVCGGPDDVLAQLTRLRRAVTATDVGTIACGLHPTDDANEPQLVDKPRYEIVREDLAGLLTTPPCGLHVHVGMPDPETAVRVCNAFRIYLPVLQALSANSPFWSGIDSGHASSRTQVVRQYPRFEVPREFRDYADFLEVADQLCAAAGVEDYTYIWWDVRPHPNLGTVEVRALDVPTETSLSAQLAAAMQAIAAKELEQPTAEMPHREALEESYFQAASHGLDADVLFGSGRPEPVRAAARRMVATLAPHARELGSADAVESLLAIVEEGNGADRQRRVAGRDGMDGLLADLRRRTT